MNASEFEDIFDHDDSVLDFLDLSIAKRILQEHKDVDIEPPAFHRKRDDRR